MTLSQLRLSRISLHHPTPLVANRALRAPGRSRESAGTREPASKGRLHLTTYISAAARYRVPLTNLQRGKAQRSHRIAHGVDGVLLLGDYGTEDFYDTLRAGNFLGHGGFER